MRVNRRGLLLAGVVVGLLAVVALTLPITLTPRLRTRLVAALNERFDSNVELVGLRVSVLPRLRVAGDGVVFRHRGHAAGPPLITIASFAAEATLLGVLGTPLRLKSVRLEGLEINIPPGGMSMDGDEAAQAAGAARDAAASHAGSDTAGAGSAAAQGSAEEPADAGEPSSPIVVEHLVSERAVLRILRREPGRRPREFEIHRLTMRDTGSNDPWGFDARLTNPTPPGSIATRGTFGPWNAARPAATPVEGTYEFRHADLGVFAGIRGTLASNGAFDGVLERIAVDGRVQVPDFALSGVGQPVPLEARFRSIVDGTNGNTWLEAVDARWLETVVRAHGGVVERDGGGGRVVTLDVTMPEARLEDVLRLAVKSSEPPMTGGLTLKTRFVLPPGAAAAPRRLELDGTFDIDEAHFAKGGVQDRIDELVRKARQDGGKARSDVASDFRGAFRMSDGVIRFSKVTFSVPGARVDVGGSYTLRSEALDFAGTVRLDAKLSQMTTGVKSFFLKVVDPIFRRDDVTVVPITIGGTVSKPSFGLDVRRAFTPG